MISNAIIQAIDDVSCKDGICPNRDLMVEQLSVLRKFCLERAQFIENISVLERIWWRQAAGVLRDEMKRFLQ